MWACDQQAEAEGKRNAEDYASTYLQDNRYI